jgi:hypothetical protein
MNQRTPTLSHQASLSCPARAPQGTGVGRGEGAGYPTPFSIAPYCFRNFATFGATEAGAVIVIHRMHTMCV